MKRMDWIWPAILIASALLVSLVVYTDLGAPLRTILVAWFLLVCPGMALVRLFYLQDILAEITIGLALSIALDTLVSLVMVYTQNWYPARGLAFLIGLTVLSAMLQLLPMLRQARRARAK